MKYWKKADTTLNPDLNPWEKDKGKALNVELTAYALLGLAAANNRDDGLPVLKWLTGQRNPEGGFSSTQVSDICQFSFLVKLNTLNLKYPCHIPLNRSR